MAAMARLSLTLDPIGKMFKKWLKKQVCMLFKAKNIKIIF